jgi:hypothetical protein
MDRKNKVHWRNLQISIVKSEIPTGLFQQVAIRERKDSSHPLKSSIFSKLAAVDRF